MGSRDIDISTERRIGDQVMRQIRIDPDYLQDPLLQEYLEGVWTPLYKAAKRLGHIGDETQQRFAWGPSWCATAASMPLPCRAALWARTSAIAMTASRDELASVLAHELSHITASHRAAHQWRAPGPCCVIAGLLLGILAATKGNIQAANAGIMTARRWRPRCRSISRVTWSARPTAWALR